MKAHTSPLGKLDHLPSKKICFQWKNGRVQTGFKGGPILRLPLLLLTISPQKSLNVRIENYETSVDHLWSCHHSRCRSGLRCRLGCRRRFAQSSNTWTSCGRWPSGKLRWWSLERSRRYQPPRWHVSGQSCQVIRARLPNILTVKKRHILAEIKTASGNVLPTPPHWKGQRYVKFYGTTYQQKWLFY